MNKSYDFNIDFLKYVQGYHLKLIIRILIFYKNINILFTQITNLNYKIGLF